MGGEIIAQIFATYGMTGLVVFIIALMALAIFIKYVTSKITFRFPWPRTSSATVDSTLKDHLFFTNAKFKLRFDIPTLDLLPACPTTQQVYRDLIYLNVESFYHGCRRLVELHSIDSMSGVEWGSAVKGELHRMLKAYEEKAEDFGIPPLAVARYAKWLATYTELLINYIEQLASSTVYGNSILRTNVFLLVMNLLIVTMVGDLDKLARETKEQLSGLEYRGTVLED
jgi:hypothetical protein